MFSGTLICYTLGLFCTVVLKETVLENSFFDNLQSSSCKAVTLNLDSFIAVVTSSVIKVLQTQVKEACMDVKNYGSVSDLPEN